ncbi:Fc.00g081440.m01.CDS01 [Cosmosporella sp. VM-42]
MVHSSHLFLAGVVVDAAAAKTLETWRFEPLPLGSVKPQGWLLNETRTLASGLFGHLGEFYDDIVNSPWLKPAIDRPRDYSPLNEGLPYWFNGLVPLSYQLDDEGLKGQVHDVADKVLSLQADDGWLGPETAVSRNFWGRVPLLLGLANLADANATYTTPVVDAMHKFLNLTRVMLQNNGEGFVDCSGSMDCTWQQVRVAEMFVTIQWLLDRHSSDRDEALLGTMQLFHDLNPLKWEYWYVEGIYPKVIARPDPTDTKVWPYIHAVNVAQGLKYFAVVRRFLKDPSYLHWAKLAVTWTFEHYGSAAGSILGDEAQMSLAPYHGTELCTVAETIYSLAYLWQATGDPEYADRAERAMFNAYPVMMTGDKIGHQYIGQQNQISARKMHTSPPFANVDSPYSTTFGLEPSYKCCTVNHGQAYPKFLANSWAKTEDGLAHGLLSSSSVKTKVNGGRVSITVDTKYPFSDSLTYNVESEKKFNLYVRVPSWYVADGSNISIDSKENSKLHPDPNTSLHRIPLPAGKSTIKYNIDAVIRSEARSNGSIAIYRGPILYSLDIGLKSWTGLPRHCFQPWDEMHGLPCYIRDTSFASTKEWNIGVDPSTWRYNAMQNDQAMPDPLYDPYVPPTSISIQGCAVKWRIKDKFVDWAPEKPNCTGKWIYLLFLWQVPGLKTIRK